jgi:ADP-ribosylglycohydrolase
MVGAIAGDIIGSRFEVIPTKSYEFELFSTLNTYTDDTVLTVAIADAIQS